MPALLDVLRDDLAFALQPAEEAFTPHPMETEATTPEYLRDAMADIMLERPLGSIEEALRELRQLWLGHATRYDSWRYQAHLNCPIATASFIGDVIATATNTAVESWDQARCAALIEDRLIKWLATKARMDPERATGTFTSGGTQSNLQALFTARERSLSAGYRLDDLSVICSAEAHYSISRAAHILGLTPKAVHSLPTDNHGSISLSELSNALETLHGAGSTVMCLVLTAGTTDLGAIDDIERSIDLARKFSTYVHVDCAYGGALLLSRTNREKLRGLSRADTFSVDFHKSFFQPVSCSALVYKDKGDMEYVSWHEDYLNPATDERLNLADRSLQTTRRFDALKLWMTLRTHGEEAIGTGFDRCCLLAQHGYDASKRVPNLEPLTEPILSTLMLRFYKPDLSEPRIDEINRKIRRRLFDTNELAIASSYKHRKLYLKLTILDPSTTRGQIEQAIRLIARTGLSIYHEENTQTDAKQQ